MISARSSPPEACASFEANGARFPLEAVRLEAPIAQPPEFLAIGLNYADHVAESGMKKPEMPIVFNKQVTCVTGPFDPIEVPTVAPTLVDYEGELGVVIGTRCRNVTVDDAPRGRRRLPRRQRRVGARLAARVADHDDGEVVGHPRPDRALARHGRRGAPILTISASAPGSTTTSVRTRAPRR